MARRTNGTYYVGRVIKIGNLDDARIVQAILNPKPVIRRKSAWTFIDAEHIDGGPTDFVFARLIKYAPEAEVKVVDPARRAEILRDEPNLSIAASPFVYIPAHSGIAFLNVAQHIEPQIFANRFTELMKSPYDNFFVECDIEFVSDLRTFAMKLEKLDSIYRLEANLYPPNPVFGPLWRGLKDYMEKRDIDTLKHDEEAKGGAALKTDLPVQVQKIAAQSEDATPESAEPLPIGDAAILMAADGYGSGLVHGREGNAAVVIRTSETIRNFSFDRNPEPKKLFEKAAEIFDTIQSDRHLRH